MMTSFNFDSLTVIQHNVLNWNNNKTALTNIYTELNPDIILLNSLSLIDNHKPKIPYYNSHYSNKDNTYHNETAIAIKHNIQYRLHDDVHSDLLAITVTTRQGPITISTLYDRPKKGYPNSKELVTETPS